MKIIKTTDFNLTAQQVAGRIPCQCSDCGMNEVAGAQMIQAYADWTSDSFEVSGFQWVIRISSDLTVEQSKSAIFREMARWQLKKKYSNDVNKILSPLFRTSPDPTVAEIDILFQ